jgi:hypothetical protein
MDNISNTNKNTSSPFFIMNIHDKNPIGCNTCWSMLSTLHNLIFQNDLELYNSETLWNIILMYLRYFNIHYEYKNKQKEQYTVHFTLEDKHICDISLNILRGLLEDKLIFNNDIKYI